MTIFVKELHKERDSRRVCRTALTSTVGIGQFFQIDSKRLKSGNVAIKIIRVDFLQAGNVYVGPDTTQNVIVKFDGEICGGVLVENASDDFPQQKKLENLLPNFAGSSPPISLQTSPTSLWKSLVLIYLKHGRTQMTLTRWQSRHPEEHCCKSSM